MRPEVVHVDGDSRLNHAHTVLVITKNALVDGSPTLETYTIAVRHTYGEEEEDICRIGFSHAIAETSSRTEVANMLANNNPIEVTREGKALWKGWFGQRTYRIRLVRTR